MEASAYGEKTRELQKLKLLWSTTSRAFTSPLLELWLSSAAVQARAPVGGIGELDLNLPLKTAAKDILPAMVGGAISLINGEMNISPPSPPPSWQSIPA